MVRMDERLRTPGRSRRLDQPHCCVQLTKTYAALAPER